MKNCLLILLTTSFLAHATSDDYASTGIRHKLSDRKTSILKGVGIIGHLGFNAMFAYFQMEQIKFLPKIPYIDDETGIAEEDKKCSPLCQENSAAIRSDAKNAENLDGVATLASVLSGIFNIAALSFWGAMQAHWGQHEKYSNNVDKFARIALGISVLNAFLDIASIGFMADSLIYHIEKIPLRTLAPLQVAVITGIGYVLPSFLFGGYGLVKIAETIEAGRRITNRFYTMLPPETELQAIATGNPI